MNKDKDLKAIAKKFFAAYDAHDVEGMLALCADDKDDTLPMAGTALCLFGVALTASGAPFRRPSPNSESK